MRILVIGRGRVGKALGEALGEVGRAPLGVCGRPPYPGKLLAEADVILVAVSDRAIGSVGEALASSPHLGAETIVLHTAGAYGPEALGDALNRSSRAGTFHPLQTFSGRVAAVPLQGVPFAIAGSEQARALGRELAEALGGVPVFVPESLRPLYHASAVLSCGQLVSLVAAAARGLSGAAAVDPARALELLAPILRTTVENVIAEGPAAALTGPVARGDEKTIAANRAALCAEDPKLATLYDALTDAARAVVGE